MIALPTYELAQIGTTGMMPLRAKDDRANLALTPSSGDAESSKNPYKFVL